MVYFFICALLFAIFIEVRRCRTELEKMPTRMVAVNVSIQTLIENVEATNRRLETLISSTSASDLDIASEIQEQFKKLNT